MSEIESEIAEMEAEESARDKILREMNVPRPLPVGMEEFEVWSNRIIDSCGLPQVEGRSLKFALAGMILQISNGESFKPNAYFINALRKGAANQIAQAVMYKAKQEQREREEAEKAKQLAEAPPVEAPAVEPIKVGEIE